jgi:hypothetical protein
VQQGELVVNKDGQVKDFMSELKGKLDKFIYTYNISKELKKKFKSGIPNNIVFFLVYNHVMEYGINNIHR